MSLFSDISDKVTGESLKKTYETDYPEELKDEVYDPKKQEEPSNIVKASAIITTLIQKSIGPTLKTSKKRIKEILSKPKESFVAGALAATVLLGGSGIIKANVDNRQMQNDIKQKILQTLVVDRDDTFDLLDKYGNPTNVYRNQDGEIVEVINGGTQILDEINPKKVVIDLENPNRYNGVFTYGTSPLSEPVKAYAREIVSAAKNSNVSPEDELRKFYSSFTQRTELQDDKAYFDYITSLIVTFMNDDSKIDYKQIKDDIQEEGINAIFGGETNENHSPRR